MLEPEGRVGDGGDEAELSNVGGESLVPCPRCLLQSIQGLLEETDVIWSGGVDEARRLLAVDSLSEMAMEKCVLHVQLVDRPDARSGDAEGGPYRHWFDNRTEGLVVVDAVALGEASDHLARLVPGE